MKVVAVHNAHPTDRSAVAGGPHQVATSGGGATTSNVPRGCVAL